MRPFLKSIAAYLARFEAETLSGMKILIPNRRAGVFLRRHLAEEMKKTGWMPDICSVDEFIDELSPFRRPPEVELVFTLYRLYEARATNPEPLETFYFWAEIMLRDFDEIDKYLVDAGALFRNIVDLREIEEPTAGLDERQIAFIRQFWGSFLEGDETREKTRFLEIWTLLPQLYQALRDELESKGLAYPGMQYRALAEGLESFSAKIRPERGFVLAGFNALNAAEQRLFSYLKEHGARFFWDYDLQYCGDEGDEAGRFLRKNLQAFKPEELGDDFQGLSKEKQIRLIELPGDVLQAKFLPRLLGEGAWSAERDCTDTAIVLCDEDLLMPVLMSLPGEELEVNVTMGYPLRSSAAFGLIDGLIQLQLNTRQADSEGPLFYYADVENILRHFYLPFLLDDPAKGRAILKRMADENLVLLSGSIFEGSGLEYIFRALGDRDNGVSYLKEVVQRCLSSMKSSESEQATALDRASVLQLIVHLNQLLVLPEPVSRLTLQMQFNLVRKMLSGLRIPFEGEPLQGLQLMGILETRLLDFRHLIVLSMNDDIMPGRSAPQSYVPYALRLAFGMPSREDREAIYAYYFKRLLQRAERVDLLFNGKNEGLHSGEMSRYLHQLFYRHGLQVERPGMKLKAAFAPGLSFGHSERLVQKLERYRDGGEDARMLSPSAINTYLDCRLKFYLRYLAGIGEARDVKEELDAQGFGTLVHDAMKQLYDGLKDEQGVITAEALHQLKDSDLPEKSLRACFIDLHFKGRKNARIEGRNRLIFKVMLRYIQKIIEHDTGRAPFRILALEHTVERRIGLELPGGEFPVRIYGTIDRIDRTGGILRVIDYKTGKAKTGFKDVSSLFEQDSATRNKAAMQTLLYCWLAGEDYPGEAIAPGLYVVGDLFGASYDPLLKEGKGRNAVQVHDFRELEEKFLESLTKTLVSIFDPTVPFGPVESTQACRYCDYAGLCRREGL
ncbi:MAG: hypothetical protein CSA96_05635 [Bacteroidetes bacterium]|nr:MAG: hypothetical protein CSA96_05635 [Bacteroidota bacterium]